MELVIRVMTVLLDQFVETLSQSGLMTAGDVDAFLDGLGADDKPDTGEKLAKLLVRHGKLTKFQAQCVYQGKTKGLVLGNYVVLESIGAGGMGHVYKARHRRMNRVVALKVLPSSVTKKRDAVRRFQREVEAAAKLTHPNIVVAYDADEANGLHFLVMEFVEGQDLARAVERHGPLPVGKAIDYVLQAARGLEYAHQQGIVHRDIKPSNLVLDQSGTVKILDMGLARFEQEVGPRSSAAAGTLTGSEQMMGTVDYVAPEQAEDAHRADQRADVYSLGCTLFYLLTGRPVYEADSVLAKLLAHQQAEVPSLSKIRPEVPEPLDRAFQRMVAKRAEERQPSMSEVIAELEAAKKKTGPVSPQGPEAGTDAQRCSSQELDLSPFSPETSAEDPALAAWLEAELPALPTRLRTKPQPRLPLTKQQKLYAAIATGAALLALVVLGVVISVRTPRGTIVVQVTPPDAEVWVDEGKITLTARGEEPVEVKVPAGEHTLEVTKGGFETHTQGFKIKSRGRKVFEVTLVPLAEEKAESRQPKAEVATAKPSRVRETHHSDSATRPPNGAFHAPYSSTVEALPPLDPAAWKAILPDDAPPPAIAPFDAATAQKHQEAWATYLGVPVNQEVDLPDGETLTMVLIPPGEFVMGSSAEEQARFLEEAREAGDQWAIERTPTEGPQHRVRITRPFCLGKYEVTQAQWEAVMGSNPSQFKDDPSHPVEHVSWDDVQQFLAKLNVAGTRRVPSAKAPFDTSAMTFTLPTEAQWEYACRAGTTTAWHCGDDEAKLQEYAWFSANSGRETHPVGELLANGFGLYDMHGNVWDWCADCWATDYYAESPPDDPSGPPTGSIRVHRGGSWGSHVRICRSAYRSHRSPDYRDGYLGLRLASVLVDE